MSVFASFDYGKMAEESERRLVLLKEALTKVKKVRINNEREEMRKRSRIFLLEDEILEEKLNLKFFRQRAKERGAPLCNTTAK